MSADPAAAEAQPVAGFGLRCVSPRMDLISSLQPKVHRRWLGYLSGALGVLVAFLVRLALGDLAMRFPFVIFLPAVVVATFLGGLGPGIATAALAGVVVDYTLLAPQLSLGLVWPDGWVAMAFYAFTVSIDILFIHGTRMAFLRAESADRELRRMNATLEDRVAERTALLEQQENERIEAEAQLRQMQKMEAVGQLTGGVAHDFNNLLTIIKSSAELLSRPSLSDEKRARYLSAISETADRAAKLTSQLLAFARRQPLVPTLFEVEQKVEGVLSMLRSIVGSTIEIEFEQTPGQTNLVDADLTQFETALVNMAVNARDAMPRGRCITIAVNKRDEIPATRAHVAAPGDYVAIEVSESEPACPRRRSAGFSNLLHTKEVGKGTGFGLSQVYGFAKQSSGEIIAASELDVGTTFTLYLPRAATIAPADVQTSDDPVVDDHDHRGCVLLVEDNRLVGEFATHLLEDLGYDVVWAPHGQAALDILEEHPERFDVVFTDVVMPGISGLDLAMELRRRRPELPVVLTSGYSQVLATEGTHGFDLLQKPYSATKVMNLLRKVAPRARPSSIAG